MKKLSFIIAILGIFILFLLSSFLPPKQISSQNELSSLVSNQKILIKGKVEKETYGKNSRILHLDNNLTLQCDKSCPSLRNKSIETLSILEKYDNKSYLKILRLRTIS
jgi:hypothetical protein